MKLFRQTLTAFATLFILSCGSTSNLQSKQNLISNGQSKDEVTKIMGAPGNKQFNGKDEAWQYYQSGMTTCKYVIVWFYESTVIGMKTYSRTDCMNCKNCYREVNWEDRPDRTIEIRNRN